MSDMSELRRAALQGAWAAAAAALQEDWDGFTLLIEDGVGSSLEASAWAMAAVGGVQAMLRHYDMGSINWDPAVNAASLGMLDEAVNEVQHQIDEEGPGVTVGRAVGQLAVAITVVARCQQQDPVTLAQRLCLDVAVSQAS